MVEAESENPRYQEQLKSYPSIGDVSSISEGPPVPRERAGMGSGFIISEDGYVVTNNHVVENARQVVVRLPDRQEFDAEVIGTDLDQIWQAQHQMTPIADAVPCRGRRCESWSVGAGDRLTFSLDFSVTAGIVSALGRSLPTKRATITSLHSDRCCD